MGQRGQEIGLILLAAIVLGISISYTKSPIEYVIAIIFMAIIIIANTIIKHITAYNYEIDIQVKPWTMSRYGFQGNFHTKKPIPMMWLPLLLALISRGYFWWLAVLEFDSKARPERMARRHNTRYRTSEVTEEHLGYIAFSGVITNLLIGVASIMFGHVLFAQLNIIYAVYSLLPIGRFDGMKILFSNKALYILTVLLTLISFVVVFQ